jgi:hypothetical protein
MFCNNHLNQTIFLIANVFRFFFVVGCAWLFSTHLCNKTPLTQKNNLRTWLAIVNVPYTIRIIIYWDGMRVTVGNEGDGNVQWPLHVIHYPWNNIALSSFWLVTYFATTTIAYEMLSLVSRDAKNRFPTISFYGKSKTKSSYWQVALFGWSCKYVGIVFPWTLM